MDKYISQNKYTFFIFALILVSLFYWYEIRPSNIRKTCEKYVFDNMLWQTSTHERERLGNDMNKINEKEREKQTFYYTECLHESGINE